MTGVALALVCAFGAADSLALVENGASPYTIVLPADPIPAEQTAANELQSYLQRVTGATLPIVGEASAPAENRIVLGTGALFKAAFPEIDPASLKHDGIVLKTRDNDVYLAGDRPRGTLYAVYAFLEDVAGCRWWSATEEQVPQAATLSVPALDVVYVPKLRYREAFYRGAFDSAFSAKTRCNGNHNAVTPEHGGHYTIIGWCHTFNRILPPEKYFDDHPEWFSEINGQRVREHSQLCLTNEEMRKEFVRVALEWIRQQPDAGIISISQNDWHGYCQCAACSAVDAEEGSHSGTLIRFVNSVAEEIEKEYPDFLIETLAYQYTRQAPKLARPRKNVLVRLCSIECSFSQPLATGPQNIDFAEDMKDWSAIAPNLFVWDYVTNFRNYILPHPNMRVLAANIRFFVDNNVVGLFEQGDSQCSCSDFPELRTWLLAKLMWDSSRDPEALIDEFLQGYYGPAAPALRDYINVIHDAVDRSENALRCYMSDTTPWLPNEELVKATNCFDTAETAVAADATLLSRVQRARMPLDHVWLLSQHALRKTPHIEAFSGKDDPQAFCEAFIARASAFNIGSYREGGAFSDYVPTLRAKFRDPGPPPAEVASLPEEAYAVVQDHAFMLHAPGRCSMYVEDPSASDGVAAKLTTDHTEWAVQYPVSGELAALGTAHCYISARADVVGDAGSAVNCGIYDGAKGQAVAQKTVPVSEMKDGAYKTIDLGAHALTPEMYIWVAPLNNPGVVSGIYVDRMFGVRE